MDGWNYRLAVCGLTIVALAGIAGLSACAIAGVPSPEPLAIATGVATGGLATLIDPTRRNGTGRTD